jgi:hypothetical protein
MAVKEVTWCKASFLINAGFEIFFTEALAYI